MNEDYDRLPPCDIDAEKCTLAAMMLNHEMCGKILRIVTTAAFLQPDHQIWFDGIKRLHESGGKVDALLVREHLGPEKYADAGGKEYLAQILGCVPSHEHGLHYATIVRDHHRRRWVHKTALMAAHAAYDVKSDPLAIASDLKAKMGNLIMRSSDGIGREGGAQELAGLIDEMETGKRRALDWPYPILSRFTKSLLPATITLLCGTPGDGKTFLMLATLMDLIRQGETAAIFMLEGDRRYHLNRCLAVLAEDSRLIDDEAIRNGNGWAARTAAQYASQLEIIGRSIYDSTREECSLAALGRWVEREARNHRVLMIDPITLAEAGKDRFLGDEAFMRSARDAITEHGTSLVLVTHPRSANGRIPTLDDLAGGKVYPRAAETVMVLRKHDDPKSYRLIDKHGCEAHAEANRELRILKARNGRGGGMHLAFDFNGARLQFAELGVIQAEEDQPQV